MDAAFGAVRMLANACIGNLRQRAADEYTRTAARLLECAAAVLSATIEMQPGVHESLAGWWSHGLATLNIPAVPEPLRGSPLTAKLIENHNFRDVLLISGHGKLVAQESACKSSVMQQLQAALAAAGLQPHNVL